jgi:hypothetical protein
VPSLILLLPNAGKADTVTPSSLNLTLQKEGLMPIPVWVLLVFAACPLVKFYCSNAGWESESVDHDSDEKHGALVLYWLGRNFLYPLAGQ